MSVAPRSVDGSARAVLEAAPDALVVVDHGGRIAFVNQRCADGFGYDAAERIDDSIELLLPEGLRDIATSRRAAVKSKTWR